MSHKSFLPQLRNIFKNSTVDSETFWKLIQQSQSSENTSTYCSYLFQYLSRPEKQRKYFYFQNQERMYATLLALEYYKNRKPKPESIVNDCKKFEESVQEDQQKWILRVFRSVKKDQSFVQGFISLLACLPLQIDWNGLVISQIQQKQRQKKIIHQNRRLKLSQYSPSQLSRIRYCSTSLPPSPSNYLSLSYICFLDYIRSNQNTLHTSEYLHIISTFKALLNQSKINHQYLQYLTLFLHFLINCITFYSCQNQDILRELIVLTGYARGCWGVVGELATELFDLLNKEMRVPGYAFRKKLRYDFPALDMKQTSFLSKQYYIVTQNEDSFSCPEDRSLLNLRKQIISHILKISCIEQEKIEQFLEILKLMAHDLTYQVYFKAMKIIEIASQLQVFDKIRHVTRQKTLQLIEQYKIRFKKDSKRPEEMQIQQFQSLMQEDNALSIFRYPLYQITHISLADFINLKSKVSFFSVLRKTRAQQSSLIFYKGNISLIFYGTSMQFKQIVRILCRFLQQADIEQCRQLQIYYLPKPQPLIRPQISSYIANNDLFYRTFIYTIFKQKQIFPYLQLTKSTKNLFPSYIMNKSLHMYLRQAKRILYIQVYVCRLKIKDVPKIQQIYFTNCIQIGLFAQAQIIRTNKLKNVEKREKYQGCSGLDIIKEKIDKPLYYAGDIAMQCIQPFTNITQKKKQSNTKFQDLQISNLPHENFFGNIPSPTSPFLQLSLLSQYNAKTFIRQLHNTNNFKQNKLPHQIYLAFKDLFINYSIKSFNLRNTNQNNQYRVVVDGEIYGKVEELDIEVPLSVNGMPIVLPVMGFLPWK